MMNSGKKEKIRPNYFIARLFILRAFEFQVRVGAEFKTRGWFNLMTHRRLMWYNMTFQLPQIRPSWNELNLQPLSLLSFSLETEQQEQVDTDSEFEFSIDNIRWVHLVPNPQGLTSSSSSSISVSLFLK